MRNTAAFCFLCVFALAIATEDLKGPAVYKPVGKCPPVDGDYPEYLPDDLNRTIFYECHAGKPIPQVCPPDLVFDPKEKVCTWDTINFE